MTHDDISDAEIEAVAEVYGSLLGDIGEPYKAEARAMILASRAALVAAGIRASCDLNVPNSVCSYPACRTSANCAAHERAVRATLRAANLAVLGRTG